MALALAGAGYAAGNYIKNREIPKIEKAVNREEIKKNSLENAADLYEQQKLPFSGEGALDVEVCIAGLLIALGFEKYLKRE